MPRINWLFALLFFCLPATVLAEGDAKDTDFIRIVYDDKQEATALETSVVSYSSAEKGVTVDLVSALHVGDQAYYDKLNQLFTNYDAVLYELIAPKGTVPTKELRQQNASVVSGFQLGLTGLLQMAFQLDAIDYTKSNFVHADHSPEEFSQSMEDRGESFTTMFLRLMVESYRYQRTNPQPATEARFFVIMLTQDPSKRAHLMKRFMADQFTHSEFMIKALNGKQGSTIIQGRNDAALEVLKQQIAAGKKKIAIFYGGGHMPDMGKKLREQFKFKRGKTTWLTAWDLSEPEPLPPLTAPRG